MKCTYDVGIVGGGIVGLAHAWMAAKRGLSVILCERDHQAQSASIRNFGMIWPIGQPSGARLEIALRSAELWSELGRAGVVDVTDCGSIHLAHRDDELAVLEEFQQLHSHSVAMLTADEVVSRCPLAERHGLLGGLWSETEKRVNPRLACARIARWLAEQFRVDCRFGTNVLAVENQNMRTNHGDVFTAERIVICSGSDAQTLFPDVFAAAELTSCKLQMLKLHQPALGSVTLPHLASGLTLRHYTSFQQCPSLATLRARVAEESPELDRFGIHVMASAFPNGEIILGDSHEYGDNITPFDNPEIERLILRELRPLLHIQDWTVTERWHGIYLKHASRPLWQHAVTDGTSIAVGPGGAGMTMSFGLAEQAWKRWQNETASGS